MTAALMVHGLTRALGVFAKSTGFPQGAAVVGLASLGLTPQPGGSLAKGDDEYPGR